MYGIKSVIAYKFYHINENILLKNIQSYFPRELLIKNTEKKKINKNPQFFEYIFLGGNSKCSAS